MPPTFVLLSDLHVSHPDLADPGMLTDAPGRLAATVGLINALDPQPAFVIVAGDLTNRGDEASYALVRELLAPLRGPAVLALGNHDARPAFRRAMLGQDSGLDAPYAHEARIAGVPVIVLDSLVPGRVGGALGDDQFAFLSAGLDKAAREPALLVIHHPPLIDPDAPVAWESLDAASTARLAAAIARRPVAGILSGHIHVDRVIQWHGVPVVTGTGLHTGVDPLYREGLRILDAASFALCVLREGALGVSFVRLPAGGRELALYDWETLRGFGA